MSTLTTIQSTDLITNSRAVINDNFTALNTDKIETSYIDTDTTLAANSDSKIATQKAVKAYVDAGGNVNASETTRGIVEEATDAEVTAGTATGGTSAKLFLTPAKLATRLAAVLLGYLPNTMTSGVTTRDISTASGNQTIAHGLGRVPVRVDIKAMNEISTGGSIAISDGAFTSSGNHCIYWAIRSISTEDSFTGQSATYSLYVLDDFTPTNYATGSITVDATNITIAWTKNGSPSGTADIMWVAQ